MFNFAIIEASIKENARIKDLQKKAEEITISDFDHYNDEDENICFKGTLKSKNCKMSITEETKLFTLVFFFTTMTIYTIFYVRQAVEKFVNGPLTYLNNSRVVNFAIIEASIKENARIKDLQKKAEEITISDFDYYNDKHKNICFKGTLKSKKL